MEFFGDAAAILNNSPLSIARVSRIVKDVFFHQFVAFFFFFSVSLCI